MSELREYLKEVVPNAIILEGTEFDDAIVGTSDDGGIVYSYEELINVLMEVDNMDYDSAQEYE